MSTLDVLQQALAAEHAAMYGYGAAGGRLRGRERADALAAYEAHRAARDRLMALITDAGATAVAAAPAYQLPALSDERAARALALTLEEGVAATYADAVAATEGTHRELAATALQETAVRAARWRGGSVAFPGLPERSEA